jgi:hypothetical protein
VASLRVVPDFYASHGYCVLVIDAYHFGRRAPRGIGGLPVVFDPFKLDQATLASSEAAAPNALQTSDAGAATSELCVTDIIRNRGYTLGEDGQTAFGACPTFRSLCPGKQAASPWPEA